MYLTKYCASAREWQELNSHLPGVDNFNSRLPNPFSTWLFLEIEVITGCIAKPPVRLYIFNLLFHFLNKHRELFRMIGGHFREDFAVDLHFLADHFGDEGAVFFTVHPERGVEARDPEAAEGSLLRPAIAIGVFAGLEESFFGGAKG